MKRIALLSFLCCTVVVAQQQDPVEYSEFVQTLLPDGTIQCVEVRRDQVYMDKMRRAAEQSGLHVLRETIGRHNRNGSVNSVAGLDIVLRATTQLEGFPAAKQAFIAAAARWEQVLMNPVTVTIDVDYGPTRFGTAFSSANVLGSTVTANFTLSSVSIRAFAESLQARNPGYADLYSSIPAPLPNTGTSQNPLPSGTLANLQVLGYRAKDTTLAFPSAPNIGFNSAFTFDLDPSDGITSRQTDFDAVAVHEIGHALGFVSAIGSTGVFRTWDLFRFRPGVVKDTATFATAQRVLTPGPNSTGGDHIFWDGTREWELSTSRSDRTGGDGQQASHWRDDALRTTYPTAERHIGIMDPTMAAGERDTIAYSDLKALSLMGWQINMKAIIDAPSNLTASSDYRTPNKITLLWRNPRRFFNGAPLTAFKLAVYRNEAPIKLYDSAKVNSVIQLVDSNLALFNQYSYYMRGVDYNTNDSGFLASTSWYAGGSPYPDTGSFVSIVSNGSTVISTFKAPVQHNDKTVLHNLARIKAYRSSSTPFGLYDSLELQPTDTGKVFMFVHTPVPKFIPYDKFLVTFVGGGPVYAEGLPVNSYNVTTGRFGETAYLEDFETNRQTMVSTGVWDSTNVAAHGGLYSFAALNYPNSANVSAYIPMVKGDGTPILRFWTICRTEAGKDFGRVEASRDFGRTWETLLQMDESRHSEWQSGNNVWFKEEISLTSYATDTILIRFRLTSDGAISKFGWLIDDIELSPTLTGIADNTNSLPSDYQLSQNYPNPFNPTTQISYSVKDRGLVSLKVYDMMGREVRTLVESVQPLGYYAVRFDMRGLSSGVYLYRLSINGFSDVKKMVVMK